VENYINIYELETVEIMLLLVKEKKKKYAYLGKQYIHFGNEVRFQNFAKYCWLLNLKKYGKYLLRTE
jgi:hypothetical protein